MGYNVDMKKRNTKTRKHETREKEIQYLKRLLKSGNVVLEGDFGSGKTYVSKEATKKDYLYTEIDLMKIEDEKKYLNNVFSQLSFFHKVYFFIKKTPAIFMKYIFPLYMSVIAIVTPILSELNIFATHLQTSLLSLLSIPILYVGALLIACLILFIKMIGFKGWKIFVIAITESNFVKFDHINKNIAWQLRSIFPKNTRFIFEVSSELHPYIFSKFHCQVMKITSNTTVGYKIQKLLERDKELDKGLQHLFVEDIQKAMTIMAGSKIWMYISTRDIEVINQSYLTSFKYLKGELNYSESIFIYFVKKCAPAIWENYNENYSYLTDSIFSPERKERKKHTRIGKIIDKHNELSQEINSDVAAIINERNWFSILRENDDFLGSNKSKIKYSFDNQLYYLNYLGTGLYTYLSYEIIDLIKTNPMSALQEASKLNINWFMLNLNVLTHEEIKSFLDAINDPENSKQILEHKFNTMGLFSESTFLRIYSAILSSIDEYKKVEFIKSLDNVKDKMLFLQILFYDWSSTLEHSKQMVQQVNLDLKNIDYKKISHGANIYHELKTNFKERVFTLNKNKWLEAIKKDIFIFARYCINYYSSSQTGTHYYWYVSDWMEIKDSKIFELFNELKKIRDLDVKVFKNNKIYILKKADFNKANIIKITKDNAKEFEVD